MNITSIMIIWWFAIIITAFQNNSVRILERRNIPYKAKGYTVSIKSVKAIIEEYSEDEEFVKKLKRALFFTRLSTILLFGWIITMLIFIFLSQE